MYFPLARAHTVREAYRCFPLTGSTPRYTLSSHASQRCRMNPFIVLPRSHAEHIGTPLATGEGNQQSHLGRWL